MTKPLDQIATTFSTGHAVLMPYFTLGYPDLETSLGVVQVCVDAGAGLMELGIPFSDPLADGPTIQYSTQMSLQNGMTVGHCLEAVRELRRRGITIPFVLMGYYNPVLAYGLKHFVLEANESGANGFIIPDLPPQEASELDALCRQKGMALSYLLAPNSTEERIKFVAGKSTGFTYLVSVRGITGARSSLPPGLGEFIKRVRTYAHTPLAVGFGISTPRQARMIGCIADGVIVGSALIETVRKAIREDSSIFYAAGQFVEKLVESLQTQQPSEAKGD